MFHMLQGGFQLILKILERKTGRQDVNNIKIRSAQNNTKEIAPEQGNGHHP